METVKRRGRRHWLTATANVVALLVIASAAVSPDVAVAEDASDTAGVQGDRAAEPAADGAPAGEGAGGDAATADEGADRAAGEATADAAAEPPGAVEDGTGGSSAELDAGPTSAPGDEPSGGLLEEPAGAAVLSATGTEPVASGPAPVHGEDERAATTADTVETTTEDVGEGTTQEELEPAPATPEPAPSALVLRTGNAVAIGNDSETYVAQTVDVLVRDGGRVRIEQLVVVVNIGAGRAITGANSLTPGAEASPIARTISTGDVLAVGNLSVTDIDQRLAIALSTGDLAAGQLTLVSNTGVAVAASGGNVAAATPGGVAVTTGDAYAIGNLAEVLILQLAGVDASGDAAVSTSQQATVVNRGLAIADSGGNLATAGGGTVTTGTAVAEGNVTSTAVTQRTIAVVGGDAVVEIRQGAVVVSIGIAIARTGGNGIGQDGAALGVSELELGVLELVLTDPTGLDGLGELLLARLADLLGLELDLLLVTEETRATTWQDAVSGRELEVVQRTFVVDLGLAIALVGDDVLVLGDLPASTEVTEAAVARLAEVRASIETGDATAFGNVSITLVCQRIATDGALDDAPVCAPPPAEEPVDEPPAAEPPSPDPQPGPQVAPVVLEVPAAPAPIWWTWWEYWTWWQPAGVAAALPTTGVDVVPLAGAALVALLSGVALLVVGRPRRRRSR